MKKNFFWSVFSLVLVLATIGAGCSKQGQQAEQSTDQSANQSVAKDEAISGSIKDLIKLGKSIKCDLAKASDTIVSGTAYVSGNKARSDFELKMGEGKTTTGHFILSGSTMYSWTDGNKAQAVKINVTEIEKLSGKPDAKNSGADNYSNSMDYKCVTWLTDASKFVPPADIKFQDFSAILNQFQNKLPAGNFDTQSMCATCDKMSNAEGKAQCRQSLGCK